MRISLEARFVRLISLMLVIVSMISSGQLTAQSLAPDATAPDATPFSRFELYSYLSEKTQIWKQGSVYYSDSGTLQAHWQGQCARGKWSTREDGSLCRHVTAWGEDSCEVYYHNGEAVSIVKDDRTMPAPEQNEGNTIDCNELDLNLALAAGSVDDGNVVSGLFTRAQTIEYLSGKTVIWGPGQGLYYAADFTLEKIWNGVRGTGSWSVNDEGAVCWHIPGWGPTPCESYYYRGAQLMAIFKGRHAAAGEHVAGSKLGSF